MKRCREFNSFFFAVLFVCVLSLGLFGCSKSGVPEQKIPSPRLLATAFVIFWQASSQGLDFTEDAVQTIENVLQDPRGWSRAGLFFKRLDPQPAQPIEKHLIVFRFPSDDAYKDESKSRCERSTSAGITGCVESKDGDEKPWHIPRIQTLSILKGEGPCIVWLAAKERFYAKYKEFAPTLYHEVGHCLGLDHESRLEFIENSIMGAYGFYPTDHDIDLIKKSIPN